MLISTCLCLILPAPIVCHANDVHLIRNTVKNLCYSIFQQADSHKIQPLRLTPDMLLPYLLINALQNARPNIKKIPTGKVKTLALQETIRLLHTENHHLFTIKDIYRKMVVSERTMQNCLKEYYVVSPKKYQQMYRFNKVRQELIQSSAKQTTVSKIAQRWGFWHMSQFAKEYKIIFQELPSHTLQHIYS